MSDLKSELNHSRRTTSKLEKDEIQNDLRKLNNDEGELSLRHLDEVSGSDSELRNTNAKKKNISHKSFFYFIFSFARKFYIITHKPPI